MFASISWQNFYTTSVDRPSVPLLKAAGDDVVAGFVQVLDRWVSLRDLINLGIPRIVEISLAWDLMDLIWSGLIWHFKDGSLICSSIEAALLKYISLRLGLLLLDSKSIVKALGIQDTFSIFSKLISQQRSLLVLMMLTHMPSLVNIRGLATIESPIVLVDIILRSGIRSVESGLICSKIWILTHASVDTEAAGHGALRLSLISTSLNSSSTLHSFIVQGVYVPECLVSLGKLAGIRWTSTALTRCILNGSGLGETLGCHLILPVEGGVVLGELAGARRHGSLRWDSISTSWFALLWCLSGGQHLIDTTTGRKGLASQRFWWVLLGFNHVHN